MSQPQVALLGFGIIGSGMAGNLLSKGFPLTVYNRTRSKIEPLAEKGAQIASTPREAVANAQVVISIVGDDVASRQVWLGEDGALNGVKPGTILVECSTLSLEWVSELAGLVEARQCKFLDSPVFGSRDAAAAGKLGFAVGGEADTIEQARPVLEAVSQRITHMGPTGAGATWKLINNMMAAVLTATVSEGLVMAERAGLNMEQVVPLIQNGVVGSVIVQAKLPRMVEQRYADTDFALRWMRKDASYATALAQSLGVPVATVEAATTVYDRAIAQDRGDLDFAAVVEALRNGS